MKDPLDRVSSAIAKYWLKENLYCGLSVSHLNDRLPDLSMSKIDGLVLELDARGDVTTRLVDNERWVYPQEQLLKRHDDLQEAKVGRYTKMLRLGASQVRSMYFRRGVLDRYREDPRYHFNDDGIHGFISIRDKWYLDEATAESDKLSIQFGAAYTESNERLVTAVLKHLDDLPLPHQQHWASYEVEGRHALDADFAAGAFEGQWTDRVSVFRAFMQELVEINKICALTGDKPLFRKDYEGEPPRGFAWLTKPTRAALDGFIHLLDKLLSENLNKEFFRGKVELHAEEPMADGRVKVADRGTIALLEDYLKTQWRVSEYNFPLSITGAFRKVRKLRQAPAHRVEEDAFDDNVRKEQEELVDEAYRALRFLRLLLTNHPRAQGYAPPDWLQNGRIG
ncbi:MAG TPA: AAA family ATPase [Candidatus Thermoplasmatota archaeon]|nr:AAA family ATPase [Candidatus Thermoplasmatota archaeon]